MLQGKLLKKSVRLPVHVRPERYKIMLKPDLERFTFEGDETIYLLLDKTTKEITLHSADLEISSAEFVHKNKENWAGKIFYNKEEETATFAFPKKLQKGKGQLKLTFKGILNDKMRGFYRSKFEHDGVVKHLATTQFESTDARRAFPCFDEPTQKAIFDVTLMVPLHMTVLSNTIESTVSEHEGGYKIVEFEPTPKMSTYLLAFIVGEFEYIEGESVKRKGGRKITVRVFTTPGKKDQAKFALAVGIACMEFYEEYFGISYPLKVLDMIAIPDFPAGAMENWGAVTYRESTLLFDEKKSSVGNKQWVAMVIAHELAHQWFGNLVTMEWWTHLWLNEGFASFIEYLAIDHAFPKWDIWNQFVASEMGVAYQPDSLKNTHPIEVEVGHPAEISEIFDKVSYAKGASILRMLHSYLGPKDFRNGLRLYLKKHAYGNTQTEDLWNALEEVSGKPVSKIMRNWTFSSGHPVITVSEHGNRLKLTQSRFYSSEISRKESKDKTIWKIPVKVHSSQFAVHSILMDKKKINIQKPKEGKWIKLNAGEEGFFRVDYPRELLKKLEDAVQGKKLSPSDRLGLLRDTFALAQSGQSPTTLALELALSYRSEDDYTVWSELTGHINQLDLLFAYESFYEDFRAYGIRLYSSVSDKMGWDKRENEKHTDSLLRSIVLYRLGSFGDKNTIDKASAMFKSSSIHPDLRLVVYNLVAENGGEDEHNLLATLYNKEDNQQEKDRVGRALGRFSNKKLLTKTLEFSVSENVRYQSSLGIIASVWGNPNGRYIAWEFVKTNWKLLKERYAGGHYFSRVFGPAGEFTKKEDAADIKKWVAKNPVPEAQRTIAQSIEQIYSNASWLARDRGKLASYFSS